MYLSYYIPLSDRAINKIVKALDKPRLMLKSVDLMGIQLHGHEGYLMDQLTSAPWNRRRIGNI